MPQARMRPNKTIRLTVRRSAHANHYVELCIGDNRLRSRSFEVVDDASAMMHNIAGMIANTKFGEPAHNARLHVPVP